MQHELIQIQNSIPVSSYTKKWSFLCKSNFFDELDWPE